MPLRLLILGGTGEAADLARALAGQPDIATISSLAGRTAQPPELPGEVRVGGFGGPEGLAAYLRDQAMDAVIDATHPFAARMAASAARACAATGIPRLKLLRPEWDRDPRDRWIEAESVDEAAARIPSLGQRVFLTVGVQELEPFARRSGAFFLIRLISPPAGQLPKDHEIVLARPPFAAEDEVRLMQAHKIDLLVTKQSGGAATLGKLAAARFLGLPVLMVRRPLPPDGPVVATIDQAMAWLERMRAV